ncbi:MAG TPA: signal peptidase I [Planctomycetota bacterium]|nr:signal peptidase I [Planctomycetota bacterium]
MSRAADPKRRRTPWRDNIEAMTVAIVMAVVLKYFIVEAYKIPTGSMQPTLMGNEETGIFDRILVDKLSYHFREPRRFEVVIFKYPLDRSKNFVKRLVGMSDEGFRILNGDAWTRPAGEGDWRVLRRPRSVQQATWKELDPDGREGSASWKPETPESSVWTIDGRSIEARGDGHARFEGHGGGSIMDGYGHGYPPRMLAGMSVRHGRGTNPVGDLRVWGRVRALPGCELVAVDLEEGARRYRLEIPGPAAPTDAAPRIVFENARAGTDGAPRSASGEPYRLPAGRWIEFGAQNLDDLLEIDIGGDVVCELEVPTADDQRSAAWVRIAGEGADLDELQVARDIYYLPGRGASEWTIPPGHYFMLGDNTQDSSDSREWTLLSLTWRADGDVKQALGNWRPGSPPRPDSNPIEFPGLSPSLTWFRDRWGELHEFPSSSVVSRQQRMDPLVPRELITGRALLVFWPFSPSLGVYRLEWIH